MGLMLDAQDCLKRMVSRCVALQSWSGNTFTEAQLFERIYTDAIPEPDNGSTHTLAELQALRPFVVLGIAASSPVRIVRDAMGGGGSFQVSGSLSLLIEQATEGTTESEIDRNFNQKIESFLFTNSSASPGLLDQLDKADSLAIQEIHCEGFFRVIPEEEISKGEAQRAYFRIDWGVK